MCGQIFECFNDEDFRKIIAPEEERLLDESRVKPAKFKSLCNSLTVVKSLAFPVDIVSIFDDVRIPQAFPFFSLRQCEWLESLWEPDTLSPDKVVLTLELVSLEKDTDPDNPKSLPKKRRDSPRAVNYFHQYIRNEFDHETHKLCSINILRHCRELISEYVQLCDSLYEESLFGQHGNQV